MDKDFIKLYKFCLGKAIHSPDLKVECGIKFECWKAAVILTDIPTFFYTCWVN